MKKLLLFAVAAFFAGSVSAQTTFTKVGTVKKSAPQAAMKIKNMQQKKMDAKQFKEARVNSMGKIRTELLDKKPIQELEGLKIKSFTPVNRISKATRRAGAFARAYNGTGLNRYNVPTQWVMTPSALDGGGDCFINLIPSPFNNLPDIPVTYTIEGSNITIPAQKVAEVTATYGGDEITLYCYLVNISASSVDGSQQLTLADDGTLTAENYYYAYVFFKADGIDWSNFYTYFCYTNVKYVDVDAPQPPVVMYEPEGTYLHAHVSSIFSYSYNSTYGIVPAQSTVSFRNWTTDIADEWSWSVLDDEDATATVGDTRDFWMVTDIETTYQAPILSGSNQGLISEKTYQWGVGHDNTDYPSYMFAGQLANTFQFSDGSQSIITRANPDFSLARYGYLATPDVNSQGYSIANLILYQGQPSTPLYFTGVNMLVYGLVLNENSQLKCKIVKVARNQNGSLELGDVIAEADLDLTATFVGEGYGCLAWTSFYKEDELGMTEQISHLFVADEFAVVLEGWDNGTFSAYPYGEYYGNDNASMNTYAQDTGSDRVYQYTDGRMAVGFIDAAYGYMLTGDDTNIVIPAEGGSAKINIGPMLYDIDDDGNAVTSLDVDEDSGSDEIPEWLDVTYTNPVQTGVDEDGDPIYDISFDLIFTAEALPAGVSERSCHLIFYQPGAQLEVNVKQAGDPTGITTTVKKTITNAAAYNLNGQRVNANYKGIVVKDGVKRINK